VPQIIIPGAPSASSSPQPEKRLTKFQASPSDSADLWIPGERGKRLSYWVAWWKRHKSSEMVELLRMFPRASSLEQLQTLVQMRMKGDPQFRHRFITGPESGRVYFLDIFQSLGEEHL